MTPDEILKIKVSAKIAKALKRSEETLALARDYISKQDQSRIKNDKLLRWSVYIAIVVYTLMAVYFFNLILRETGLLHTHF